jgi:hypothetical protein
VRRAIDELVPEGAVVGIPLDLCDEIGPHGNAEALGGRDSVGSRCIVLRGERVLCQLRPFRTRDDVTTPLDEHGDSFGSKTRPLEPLSMFLSVEEERLDSALLVPGPVLVLRNQVLLQSGGGEKIVEAFTVRFWEPEPAT